MESNSNKVSDAIEKGKRHTGMCLNRISVMEKYLRDMRNTCEEEKRNFEVMQSVADDDQLNHSWTLEKLQDTNEQLGAIEKLGHTLTAREQLIRDEMNEVCIKLQKMESYSNKVSDAIEEGKRHTGLCLNRISGLEKYLRDMRNTCEEQKRNFEVMQSVADDDQLKHSWTFEKLQDTNEQLLGAFEELSHTLTAREQLIRDEMNEVCVKLKKGFYDTWGSRRDHFGIKRMGKIDKKTFLETCMEKFPPEEARLKALELRSFWQDKLADPEWYPFYVVEDDNGIKQEVVNENDELLVDLKNTWGEQTYFAVVTAFKELNEHNSQYNPSGEYTVPELWNFRHNRKASAKEVISYIFKQIKSRKRKKAPVDYTNKTKKTKTGKSSKQELRGDRENVNDWCRRSNDEMPGQDESEQKPTELEEESIKDKRKKQTYSVTNANSAAKSKTNEVNISKKASALPRESVPKSPKRQLIKKDESNVKKSSAKNKDESVKKPIPEKSAPKESTRKLKEEDAKEGELSPTDEELRNAVFEILMEVDWDADTLYDILKLLVKHFDTDLTPRIESIKRMVKDYMTELPDGESDDDEDFVPEK